MISNLPLDTISVQLFIEYYTILLLDIDNIRGYYDKNSWRASDDSYSVDYLCDCEKCPTRISFYFYAGFERTGIFC